MCRPYLAGRGKGAARVELKQTLVLLGPADASALQAVEYIFFFIFDFPIFSFCRRLPNADTLTQGRCHLAASSERTSTLHAARTLDPATYAKRHRSCIYQLPTHLFSTHFRTT